MTAKTAELYARIQQLTQQAGALDALPDSPDYWRTVAGLAQQQRDLWRQLGEACGSEVPDWARIAAFNTADLYSDRAYQYQRYVRETTPEASR